ncbi:MAG: DHH family phosphoesterase [Deltaproteobacteria bacterium HGW-Deltaproteobacteria-10]|nr:MAG: DHH family phosphoesterase [Deltaproteobacteria bacterium HGW-Deltaproteobacteria-10]
MFKEIIAAINEGQNFLITSHIRLDGDALGSELAVYLMLRDLGKNAVIYNQDNTPEHYRFLPAARNIVHTPGDLEQYDAVFVLDCSELDRVGDQAEKFSKIKKLINIDHHVSNGGFCDIRLIDAQASSTGELIYRLMKEMSINMTKEICTNLYAAILTDTGGFRYSNTRHGSLWAAATLVEKGADPQWISENIYESDPPAKLKLLAKTMETLSLDLKMKVGSLVVTHKMLQEAGASMEHLEGFVDIPRAVQGIEISVLYSQLNGNSFKLSLRSKGQVNVEKVAKKFGGGGHVNAAACRIEGDIESIKNKIMEAIKEL